jgi:hypothetical protein
MSSSSKTTITNTPNLWLQIHDFRPISSLPNESALTHRRYRAEPVPFSNTSSQPNIAPPLFSSQPESKDAPKGASVTVSIRTALI